MLDTILYFLVLVHILCGESALYSVPGGRGREGGAGFRPLPQLHCFYCAFVFAPSDLEIGPDAAQRIWNNHVNHHVKWMYTITAVLWKYFDSKNEVYSLSGVKCTSLLYLSNIFEKSSCNKVSIGYFEATRGYVIYSPRRAAPTWINTYPRGASK
jgi:hypothetical protein